MIDRHAINNISSFWVFLWQVIKPYKWWYVLMFQAPIITGFYLFANNYSFKLVIDAFASGTSVSYADLLVPISLFIIAQIILDLVWRLSNFAELRAEPKARQRLLLVAYDYVQHHSFQYFQNTPSGSIISKIKGLLDGYDHIFASLHHTTGKYLCVVLVSIFALLLVNTTLFVFMVIWSVVMMVIMMPMALKLNRLSNAYAESKHKVLGMLSDNITNMFSLLYFAKRQTELKRLHKITDKDFIPSQVALYKFELKFGIVGSVLYWIMLISIFLFMIYLRKNNEISSGDFIFVMSTAIAISFDLWSLMYSLSDFMKEIGDIRSSFTIIAKAHEEVDGAEAKSTNIEHGDIEFKEVTFAYDAINPVFSNLNLRIKPGEKIGLIGHSGAGKSTLIALLMKNFCPNSGEIFIDKKSMRSLTADCVRKHIALIPQDILLFHRSIAENIAYAKEHASLEEVKQAARMAHIDTFIESLPEGYDTLVGERGIKLSGGQRQRVAIARAFLKNAPIIILDEATSSLDSITEQEIQSSINLMLEKRHATVIAIAHRLSTIRHMDRIIVMEGGSILEEGTFAALMKIPNGYFKLLWNSQVNGMVV